MPSHIGPYKLIKTLGSGVTAKVKLAENEIDGSKVALKVFDLSNPANNQRARDLLKKEVQIVSNLNQYNIVRVHDFQEETVKTHDITGK